MMPLRPFPPTKNAPEGKSFSSRLRHRSDFLGKNLLKEIKESLAAEINVRLVAVEIRLAHIFEVFGVILIQLDDFFNQRLVAGKVCPI